MDKKPILAFKEKVDYGVLYKGVGYKALYCDSGKVYTGIIDDKTCFEGHDSNSFQDVFYRAFVSYASKKKLLDSTNLVKIELNNITFDEYNSEGGSDYLVDLHYMCIDGSSSCFKTLKETDNQTDVKLYISLNKENKVYDIKTFKKTGEYYNILKNDYLEKVKQYYINTGKINVDNLRMFNIELIENHGRYKYDGVMYSDSYVINIDYFCKDNSNTCVIREDYETGSTNMSFMMAMFLDNQQNVALIKKFYCF